MKLSEVFDNPKKIKWQIFNPAVWSGNFSVDGTNYEIAIANGTVEFMVLDENGRQKWGIEKTGNQFAVFSTVIDGIKQYIQKVKPKQIYFNAKEGSRKKLYQTLVKKLSGSFGYKQVTDEKILKKNGFISTGDDFLLLRQK